MKFISEKLQVQTVDGQLATELFRRKHKSFLRTLTLYLYSVVPDYQFRMPTKTTLINNAKCIRKVITPKNGDVF